MRHIRLLLLYLVTAVVQLMADSPAPPMPYIATAGLGSVYFRMVPRQGDGWRNGFGVACRIRADGSDEVLWRTEGWYSFEVFLSNDGKYLVAMGPWNDGQQPAKRDLAVAFYCEGKLLKQYSTADLVKDNRKVLASTSHYMWLARDTARRIDAKEDPEAKLEVDWNNVFHLKTCDGILYEFDMATGEIKSQRNSKTTSVGW